MRKKKMQQWIAVMMAFTLLITFTLTGAVCTVCAGERLLTGTAGATRDDVNRQKLKAALLDIGYDENEAAKAIADLNSEEIDMLANNPKLLVRTGNAALTLLALLFLTTLCDDDDNRSTPEPAVAARQPAPKVQSRRDFTGSVPAPIEDNSGRYMCPYTQDGVMAGWTDMAINLKLGKTAGAVVGTAGGAYAGKELGKKLGIPFGGVLGGVLGGAAGNKAGSSAGRKIGFEAAGGWDNIRQTSDLSFNDLEEMAHYLRATHSSHEHFKSVMEVTGEIYPEFKRYIY
jgi:hypothetical protein